MRHRAHHIIKTQHFATQKEKDTLFNCLVVICYAVRVKSMTGWIGCIKNHLAVMDLALGDWNVIDWLCCADMGILRLSIGWVF